MAISFDPQTNWTNGTSSSGNGSVKDDDTKVVNPVNSDDNSDDNAKINITEDTNTQTTEIVEEQESSSTIDNTEQIETPISLDLSGLDTKTEENTDTETVVEKENINIESQKTEEKTEVNNEEISLDLSGIKVTETSKTEKNTEEKTIDEVETVWENKEEEINLNQISLNTTINPENKDEAEKSNNESLNVNDINKEVQQTDPIEDKKELEDLKIESSTETKVKEKTELQNDEEIKIDNIGTEKNIELKLPTNWEEKKDDSWIEEEQEKEKKEEQENEKKEEQENWLEMPDIQEINTEKQSIEVPQDSTVSQNLSTNNENIDKSGLDLTAISMAKIQWTENSTPPVTNVVTPDNTLEPATNEVSQWFDLDSMISNMQEENSTPPANLTSNPNQQSEQIQTPTSIPVQNNVVNNQIPNYEQTPNTNISANPSAMPMQTWINQWTTIGPIVPETTNPTQEQAKISHKKENTVKIITLIVLLIILAGFLLNTMYPKEIKDLFNKFSSWWKPEMPTQNDELVLSWDVENEDQDNEISNTTTGIITSWTNEEFVEDTDNLIETGTVELEDSEEVEEVDEEAPFADLDELLDDIPVDPNAELIQQLKDYQTQWEDFLELAEIAEDAVMLKYSTVLATVPLKDIELIESGDFELSEIESHIKRLDLYLAKLNELVGEEIQEEDPTAPLKVEDEEPTVSVEDLNTKIWTGSGSWKNQN